MKWDETWAEIKPYRPTATMYNINFVFNLLQFEQTERKQIFIVAINYSLMPETFNMTEATQTIYTPVYMYKCFSDVLPSLCLFPNHLLSTMLFCS